MTGLLSGKVVCITGSSRGIGRACAIESANQGARGLILHYFGDAETQAEIRTLQEEVEKRFPGCRIATTPGDIADPTTSTKVWIVHVHRPTRATHSVNGDRSSKQVSQRSGI